MKKIVIIGFIVVGVMGTVFHFLYDYIPLFIFPRGESIFEHTKLTIFPFLIYYLFLLLFRVKNKKLLFSSFVTAILASTAFIVVFYYTYSGMIGKSIDWLNIVSFFIAILIGFYLIYKRKTLFNFVNSVVLLIFIILLSIIFSYFPLDIAFFKEPNSLQFQKLDYLALLH